MENQKIVRALARAEVKRVHAEARARGEKANTFRVRALAENAVRDVWKRSNVAPEFRTTIDRKTASLGTCFALSECNPSKACAVYCYVLQNMATGLNSAASVAQAVENTLAADANPEAVAEQITAEAKRRGLTLRLSTGGEAKPGLIKAVAARIPTRMLFSVDKSTRRAVPNGARVAYVAQTETDKAPNGAHVVFGFHRAGKHVETQQAVPVCEATASNNVCGVSCFHCFPSSSKPRGAVAWGFTRKPRTWEAVAQTCGE